MTLRSNLIKLAHDVPEMRRHIVPLLRRTAGSLSSEVIQFLNKASKGVKGNVNFNVAEMAVLALGWKVERVMLAEKMESMRPLFSDPKAMDWQNKWGAFGGGWGDLGLGNSFKGRGWVGEPNMTQGQAEQALKELKQLPNVVIGSPPASPKMNVVYLSGLDLRLDSRIEADGHRGWNVTVGKKFIGQPGWEFTAKNGQRKLIPLKLDGGYYLQDPTKAKGGSFWGWAYKQGLKEQAIAALQKADQKVVEQAVMTKAQRERSLDNTGTCGICMRNIKLAGGTVIGRHGWAVEGERERGSWGLSWHTGPCFGTGFVPYEVSNEACVKYLPHLKKMLVGGKKHLAALNKRPKKLTYTYGRRLMDVFRDAPAQSSGREYDSVLRDQIYQAQNQIKLIEEDARAISQRIKNWKPEALPG